MGRDSHRTLEVLEEISNDHRVTQRSLSQRLGISLGIANLYMKRLAKKGYIKITTVPGKRLLRYMLTPQGLAEKTRLTYEFASYSYRYLGSARRQMFSRFEQLRHEGVRRVVLCGTGELSELAYLAMVESGLELAGVVAEKTIGRKFLGRDVAAFDSLGDMTFDALIVLSEEDMRSVARFIADGTRVAMMGPGAPASVAQNRPEV